MANARAARDIHEAHRVSTPLELLFDLTFVAAISVAATQLHHGLAEQHLSTAIAGFAVGFWSIWLAWMGFTWYASAYDSDDASFRLLAMVQMVGVLVLAVGVPGMSQGQWKAGIIGYVIMRLALVAQWLLAARGDPARRGTCLRYACGIATVQLLWVAWLWSPPQARWPVFALLALCELAVPVWAERGAATPWHPHHIAERHGLFVIMTLGECVIGATSAIASLWRVGGWSFDLALVGFASMALVLSLWWMYFLMPTGEALERHRERARAWTYGHFFVFFALAAVGAGLEIVADTLAPGTVTPGEAADPLFAILAVALPEALFVLALWGLHAWLVRSQDRSAPVALACIGCILAVPLAVHFGLRLPWALLLSSLGPVLAIVHHELGRVSHAERFAVR